MDLKRVAIELGKVLNKNAPTLLTGLGVASFVSTVVMAVRATPTALELIEAEKYRRKKEEDLPPIDVVKAAWKAYIPTVVNGAIGITCIIMSNSISLKRQAVLAGLYSLAQTSLREYQDKVVEIVGERKAGDIRDGIAQDKLNADPLTNKEVILLSGNGSLFYDPLSARYFTSTMEAIKKAINDFNYVLMQEMNQTLNEFYYLIGLDGIDLGNSTGWDIDHGLLDIRFSAKIATDGRPCIVLDFNPPQHLL